MQTMAFAPAIWVPRSKLDFFERNLSDFQCFERPLLDIPQLIRLSANDRPGLLPAFAAGEFQIQEFASQLPIRLLAHQLPEFQPRTVLDMCAAPGNKTAQMADHWGPKTWILANDLSYLRLRPLRRSQERLGYLNVSCTHGNGVNWRKQWGEFEFVLADVPCSGENYEGQAHWQFTPDSYERLIKQQQLLLRRAIQITQQGGIVNYSTCTHDSRENEACIGTVLRELRQEGYELELIPIHSIRGIPPFLRGRSENAPGLSPKELESMARTTPSIHGVGAFFICWIRVVTKPEAKRRSSLWEDLLKYSQPITRNDNIETALDRIEKRYRIPMHSLRDGIYYQELGQRKVAAMAHEFMPGNLHPQLSQCDALGLRAFRLGDGTPKISTSFALRWGSLARENVIELKPKGILSFLSRDILSDRNCISDGTTLLTQGFVFVRDEQQRVYGMGLWKNGELHSMAPKGGFLVKKGD